MDKAKFNKVVADAKAKTNDAAWLRSLEKAAAGLLDGSICVTLFADNTALVTTPNGSYRVNGHCPCASRQAHCYHRSAKRLWTLYEEALLAEQAALRCDAIIEDIKAIGREMLVADIQARTNAVELSAWLQKRAGVTRLDSRFLNIEVLRQIHQALAA